MHPSSGEQQAGPVLRETAIDLQQRRRHRKPARDEGAQAPQIVHYTRPRERPFTRAERPHTTVLFGGLTWKHESLIQASLSALGYRCEALLTPTASAFQTGREYGNHGQCNPTYFTVGNLVEHLQQLEQHGLSKQEIIDRYVFVTAGACGPCRFGMYEAEYRLALQNAGFDGFRVLLFQQKHGFNQSGGDAGLDLNVDFFLALLNAFCLGDLLNDIAYRIRPYEKKAGETDRVLKECIDRLAGELQAIIPRTTGRFRPWLHYLFGRHPTRILREVRRRFATIEVDWFRVRPVVKITGEFWAQTTEGDGNFNMFAFLEQEDAQVLVEPVGTWILYMLHQTKQKHRDRRGLMTAERGSAAGFITWPLRIARTQWRLAVLTLAEQLFIRHWNRCRGSLSNHTHPLTSQYTLQSIARPWYNSRAQGGEGHLEVAKNVYYSTRHLCHMVLSLKPFGCMPSTQSDGVQSAIMSRFPDITYLPVETSGEGGLNAHSRVQMTLGEAHARAREEFTATLRQCRHSLEAMRVHVAAHPGLRSAMLAIPHTRGTCGTAANFARFVDAQMTDALTDG